MDLLPLFSMVLILPNCRPTSVNIGPPVRRKSEILGILERMRSSPLDRVIPSPESSLLIRAQVGKHFSSYTEDRVLLLPESSLEIHSRISSNQFTYQ
jgi:hypothetical protein